MPSGSFRRVDELGSPVALEAGELGSRREMQRSKSSTTSLTSMNMQAELSEIRDLLYKTLASDKDNVRGHPSPFD
eukprot:3466876-Pyramimonas_sp.AAC.1